ncbi:MAG: hypothetical protein DHS20C17_06220 [Cyclobacteriaceae bacterium]|nr:MAG: hypothetical protein DHS20C17_06220 [Cyclobacteriaceae bacterium]
MWSIKPYKSPPSECPECKHCNGGFKQYSFVGAQILGNGSCEACGCTYYHNWPIAHGADYPVTYSNRGKWNYSIKARWLAEPMIRTIKNDGRINAKIKRTIRKPITNVFLLNCLDVCYGHVLWKLFNAGFYQHLAGSQGLVVLIPENCAWLVPDYAAEIWAVEIELPKINLQIQSITTFINKVSDQYQSIEVLPVLTHIDHQTIKLEQFIRQPPFQLNDFSRRPFCITFIWREDRFWLRSQLEQWLNLLSIKFSIELMRRWFRWRQVKTMTQVARLIQREIDEVTITIVGIGTSGKFPSFIRDLRQRDINPKVEAQWCEQYSNSHLVIGVHGSNMLIPTALAAGYIALLPKYKLPFITEDILMKHPSRFQTFLGRHLDLFSSSQSIASHATSMLNDFEYLYRNTTATP